MMRTTTQITTRANRARTTLRRFLQEPARSTAGTPSTRSEALALGYGCGPRRTTVLR